MTHWHMVCWPLVTKPAMVDVHRNGVRVLEWSTFNAAFAYIMDAAVPGDTYQEQDRPVLTIDTVANGRLALGGTSKE